MSASVRTAIVPVRGRSSRREALRNPQSGRRRFRGAGTLIARRPAPDACARSRSERHCLLLICGAVPGASWFRGVIELLQKAEEVAVGREDDGGAVAERFAVGLQCADELVELEVAAVGAGKDLDRQRVALPARDFALLAGLGQEG